MIDLLTATLTATRCTISPSTKIITHDPTPDRDHRGQSRTPRMGLRIRSSEISGRDLLLAAPRYRPLRSTRLPVRRQTGPSQRARGCPPGSCDHLTNHLDHRTLLQPIDHLPDYLVANTSG